MKKNMGKIDRLARFLFAVIVILLIMFDQITNIAAVVLGIFSIVLLITSATGICPLYYPLKINTKSDKNN